MPIIAWLAKGFIARKVSERFAVPLAWLTVIVAVLLVAAGAYQLVKHNIIATHDAKGAAKTAEKQLQRVQKADGVDHTLGEQDATAAEAVKGARDHAVHTDPQAGNRPVGPVSNATVDELRRQRAHQQRQ